MKKILIPSFLFLTFAVPLVSSAADKIVTVEWTMPTATVADVQSYSLYYSPYSDMSGAAAQTCEPWQQTGNQGDQTLFSMTCNNVSFVPGQLAYFTLEAVDTEGVASNSNIFVKDTKLSTVLNFQAITPGANLAPVAVITANPTSGYVPLTVNFDASGSSDDDGSVVSYSWNFGDGSAVDTTVNPSHSFSTVGTFQVSLVVDDDKGKSSEFVFQNISTTDKPANQAYAINFQPAAASVPNGFVVDSGQTYDTGRGYGWLPSSVESGARDRNNANSADQSYDTLIIVNNTSTSIWEHNLPNGTYSVTMCMGDAVYPGSTNNIQIEGIPFFENIPINDSQPWIEKTQTVNVLDGKLTITFTGTDPYAQICWIAIQ